MADNTIDSLEIKIESSADQAVRSLENLSAKLTTIKNTLGNTNVGFDLSGISKTTQAVEGLQKSVNKLPKNKLTLDASKIDYVPNLRMLERIFLFQKLYQNLEKLLQVQRKA